MECLVKVSQTHFVLLEDGDFLKTFAAGAAGLFDSHHSRKSKGVMFRLYGIVLVLNFSERKVFHLLTKI